MARTTETGEGVRVFATPLAKRIAQQRGIDLLSVKGTGPYGRIVVSDLDGELAPGDHPERKAMDAAVEKSHKGSQQTTKVLPGVAVSAEQVSGNAGQKPEARRSERSVDPVPQFSLTTDVTLDNLLELQGRLNVLAPNDVGGANHWQVSFDGLVMKAVALAMLKHPGTNVSWTGETVAMHQHADVGLVAQTPGGVRVSVVRRVEGKGVAQISSEACEYAHQATVRAPTSEAFEGGAVALFNIAKSGIRQFNAVVEPPFSSVLALGAVECRPIVKCGEIVKARQMTVTLSSDIRCIDVGLGGDFLLSIKNYLEEPGLMLV